MSAGPERIAALKAAIQEREGRPIGVAGPVADADTTRRVVAEEVGRLSGCPPEHVRADQALADLPGMDDLAVVELALAIEGRLQLLQPLFLRGRWTVGEVAACAAAIPRERPRE